MPSRERIAPNPSQSGKTRTAAPEPEAEHGAALDRYDVAILDELQRDARLSNAELAARIPHKIAMELLLLGEPIGAQRAYEVGFVNKVVPVGQQLDAALEYAEKIAANAPLVLSMLKRFVGQTLPKGPTEAAAAARRQVDEVTFSADIEEGIAAFKAKRAPDFRGV